MRYMGIDYGTVRIGVAVSDPLGVVAQGIESIRVKKHEPEAHLMRLLELVKAYEIGTIVLGLPRRTDGKVGSSELGARALGDWLKEQVDIPVVLWDERFTSTIANRILQNSTVKKQARRDVVDQVAAEVLLTDYLNQCRKSAF